jgi:two-component system NtrC family sensor kinase
MKSRPLEELRKTIAQVHDGNLSARVEFAKDDDDLVQFGRQFNDIIRQLDENRREIEELHKREINNGQHLATLGELAAGLAHQIRNPLAGIAGVVDIMSKELPANSSSRAVIGDVQREILHIQAILNDLLSYSRPRAPNFYLANLNTTVEQAIERARQQLGSKPIRVKFEPNSSLPPVEHDPALIQQAILNLILNGIQTISGNGEVRVALAQDQDFAVIEVSDTGRGISAEVLPKIFKPFFTTCSEGTGLGLSLANAIVQSQAGRIEVTSTPGKGTQFRISLPLQHLKKC